LISRGPTSCTTQQRPTNTEPLRKLTRSGQKPVHRSKKRLDWHTCMPPVNWLHRHLRAPHRHSHAPEPSGVRCSANCARRTSVLHGARIPPPSLFGSSPSVSRTLTRVPPGTHRNLRVPSEHLRVFTERLRAFTRRSILPEPGLPRPTRTTCG